MRALWIRCCERPIRWVRENQAIIGYVILALALIAVVLRGESTRQHHDEETCSAIVSAREDNRRAWEKVRIYFKGLEGGDTNLRIDAFVDAVLEEIPPLHCRGATVRIGR